MWKKSSNQSSLLLAFPILYILLDTFLVVFINVTSAHGQTSYNTFTANAITECIKLSIALYAVMSENSWKELISLDYRIVLKFGLSNLMYAINNNLFHYSIGALPPAVFVVSINAMRTILTAIFQQYVSNKSLTIRQFFACFLLALSFIFTSLTDIVEVLYMGHFRGSKFSLLLLLAGIYSSISVSASLVQEKLLKDSPSLMIANVINYSYGVVLQVCFLAYFSLSAHYKNSSNSSTDGDNSSNSSNDNSIFRGFDIFWIQLIPIMMAMSGISISFVLRYFDNIVKLICSSVAVLLVHSFTAYMSGNEIFNIPFICGWFLTIPAAYLYYVTPTPTTDTNSNINSNSNNSKNMRDEEENVRLLSENSDQDSNRSTMDRENTSIEMTESYVRNKLENSLSHDNDSVNENNDNAKLHKNKIITPASVFSTRGDILKRGLFFIVILSLFIFSLNFSSFELPSNKNKDIHSVSDKNKIASPRDKNILVDYLQSCPLYEVSNDDPNSNLRYVSVKTVTYGTQFSYTDAASGVLYVSCPENMLFVLLPPIKPIISDKIVYNNYVKSNSNGNVYDYNSHEWQLVKHTNSHNISSTSNNRNGKKHRQLSEFAPGVSGDQQHNNKHSIRSRFLSSEVEVESSYQPVAWKNILMDVPGRDPLSHVWLYCDKFKNTNIVVRPPLPSTTTTATTSAAVTTVSTVTGTNSNKDLEIPPTFSTSSINAHNINRKPLNAAELAEIRHYIETLSVPIVPKLVKPVEVTAHSKSIHGLYNSENNQKLGRRLQSTNNSSAETKPSNTSTSPTAPVTPKAAAATDIPANTASGADPITQTPPVFNGVVIVYLDAVSRKKFQSFYKKSYALLKSMLPQLNTDSDANTNTYAYKNSENLDLVMENKAATHMAIPLNRLHSTGINSHVNYLPMFAGINPDEASTRFKHADTAFSAKFDPKNISAAAQKDQNVNFREPWLFDLAEYMGYETLSGYSGCHFHCKDDCAEWQKTHDGVEVGGYGKQYMMDTHNRNPGMINWPSEVNCEVKYRPQLTTFLPQAHVIHNHIHVNTYNELPMTEMFDWALGWLARSAENKGTTNRRQLAEQNNTTFEPKFAVQHNKHNHHNHSVNHTVSNNSISNSKNNNNNNNNNNQNSINTMNSNKNDKDRKFGVLVFQDTHRESYFTNFDDQLAGFIAEMFTMEHSAEHYHTDNTAVIILSDHGLHFTSEFKSGTGKIANKQPFGYVLLPKEYLRAHKTEYCNLHHNSQLLLTPYDLRATVQHWITGRNWNSAVISSVLGDKKASVPAVANAPVSTGDNNDNKNKNTNVVYASHFGNSVLTSHMSANRTCKDAGIPPLFCGCNLMPCENNMKSVIKSHFHDLAVFMNNRVLATTPQASQVCIPLTASDFMLVPGTGTGDCLTAVDDMGVRTTEINIVVTRNNALLSVTFRQELHTKSSKSKSSKPGKMIVEDVNTVSNYGHIWEQCAAQFDTKHIAHNTIHSTNWQFCYCRHEEEKAYGSLLKFVSWFQ